MDESPLNHISIELSTDEARHDTLITAATRHDYVHSKRRQPSPTRDPDKAAILQQAIDIDDASQRGKHASQTHRIQRGPKDGRGSQPVHGSDTIELEPRAVQADVKQGIDAITAVPAFRRG
jgi:hypothetical protein